MESRSSQWKLTSIGMAVVIVTALVTGLVVARWWGVEISRMDVESSREPSKPLELPPRSVSPAASPETAGPSMDVTKACNAEAARVSGSKTKDDKIAVGSSAGMLYGIDTYRQHDETYRAAYSACMRQKGYTI
jgi:hypothetical protein